MIECKEDGLMDVCLLIVTLFVKMRENILIICSGLPNGNM